MKKQQTFKGEANIPWVFDVPPVWLFWGITLSCQQTARGVLCLLECPTIHQIAGIPRNYHDRRKGLVTAAKTLVFHLLPWIFESVELGSQPKTHSCKRCLWSEAPGQSTCWLWWSNNEGGIMRMIVHLHTARMNEVYLAGPVWTQQTKQLVCTDREPDILHSCNKLVCGGRN